MGLRVGEGRAISVDLCVPNVKGRKCRAVSPRNPFGQDKKYADSFQRPIRPTRGRLRPQYDHLPICDRKVRVRIFRDRRPRAFRWLSSSQQNRYEYSFFSREKLLGPSPLLSLLGNQPQRHGGELILRRKMNCHRHDMDNPTSNYTALGAIAPVHSSMMTWVISAYQRFGPGSTVE